MILLSGSSNQPLAEKIAQELGMSLGALECSTFVNGERRVYVKEKVKGQDVAIIQSFSDPVDSHIIEFALITDALFRQGARRVFAVIPWFGYSLQDKVHRPGEPIAAKVIASMLSSQSVYRFVLMNLHNSSTTGFFSVPSSHLSSDEVFAKEMKKIQGDIVLVSSDFGGLKRVGRFASEYLNVPIANIDKHRDLQTGAVTARSVMGDVKGKTCIILDDMINGGGTVIEAAHILKEEGAVDVQCFATHAIFAGEASAKLQASEVSRVVVSDTIDTCAKSFPKLHVVSVASVFAQELKDWIS
ncbi:ribose-phosphate pyrophosphokinase [Candidatus Cerribacteria bacterium 'Amazon FNV 2010 28 9']|uniref:ribose-phosphate diphosphokinase n=1 Tax=Candidatus Cerribacteria bacterium 'Amazon FNV 2010 28 9' TaxID=2081795 RepID=A0A317JUN6_9BACT|nr:MAG: ribose-phosphate pyrophosphokinase [Candidatus Cerribacteria bacterium 'Amazon FNV 2010 28 9']